MIEGIPEEALVNPPNPEGGALFEKAKMEMGVNLEGNETGLLISRLRNPIIKRQIAEINHEKKDRKSVV